MPAPDETSNDPDPTDDATIEDSEEELDAAGEMPKAVRQRLEAFVPELVKRGITAGMGALMSSEEGIRRLTKDMPVPKDIAGYLVNTASSSKDELLRIIAREVREFLQTVNLSEEIAKMLTTLSFEVKTEIRFIPNDEKFSGVEPDVKAKVRLKRSEEKRSRRRRRRKKSEDEAADTDKTDE